MTQRIEPAEPPYAPSAVEDFEKLMPTGVPPLGIFRTLARNPRVLGRVRRGGLLDRGSLTIRQREIVILRMTAIAGSEYEWGVHVAFFGGKAGFEASHLHATVWLGADAGCWTAEEALLVRACDELHASALLSAPTWDGMRRHFDEAQLVEIVVLAGQYRMIAGFANAVGLPLEENAPRFPPR